MSALRVVEASGAQVLPPVVDPRKTVPSWSVACCLSTDQRAKHRVYFDLASTLIVELAPCPHDGCEGCGCRCHGAFALADRFDVEIGGAYEVVAARLRADHGDVVQVPR